LSFQLSFFDHILNPLYGPNHIYIAESIKESFLEELSLIIPEMINEIIHRIVSSEIKTLLRSEDLVSDAEVEASKELIISRIHYYEDWDDLNTQMNNKKLASVVQFYGEDKKETDICRTKLRSPIFLENSNLLDYQYLIPQTSQVYINASITQEIFYRNSIFKSIRGFRR
jgi:hypothetical protein